MVHVNRLQIHITREQEYFTNQLKKHMRENYNSGGVYNRSENELLDRSHRFRDRTEESRPPEEERESVSKSFRPVGDDWEIQLSQWEESVTKTLTDSSH